MKRKIMSLSILITLIIMIAKVSYGYGTIEIKPAPSDKKTNAAWVLTSIKVSDSYLLCRGMTDEGGSLEGATVEPHLTTNADWAAVSYLSQSIYGTNGSGKNGTDNSVKVEINGVEYYSTNANKTGVMNWGNNRYKTLYTQTASLITNYSETNSTAKNNVIELKNNISTGYVETISGGDKGRGFSEINGLNYGQWIAFRADSNYPICIRQGLFGYGCSSNGYTTSGSIIYPGNNGATGASMSQTTFRPVIWNK